MSRVVNNSHLDNNDSASLDVTGRNITIAGWVWPTSVSGSGPTVLGKWESNKYGYVLYAKGSFLRVDWGTGDGGTTEGPAGGAGAVVGSTPLSVNTWQHWAARKSAVGSDVLLNGVVDGAVASAGVSIGNTSGQAHIGWDGFNTPPATRLAEIGLWDVPLSNAEVAALAKGVNPLMIRRGNLRAYWPLYGTDGAGGAEPDYSGNHNIAGLVGGVSVDAHPPVMPLAVLL